MGTGIEVYAIAALLAAGTAVQADSARKAAHGQLDQQRKQAADDATAQAMNEEAAQRDARLADEAQRAAEQQDTSATVVDSGASTAQKTTATKRAQRQQFAATSDSSGLSL